MPKISVLIHSNSIVHVIFNFGHVYSFRDFHDVVMLTVWITTCVDSSALPTVTKHFMFTIFHSMYEYSYAHVSWAKDFYCFPARWKKDLKWIILIFLFVPP